jgi:two-component system phosphate regulon response regulator PhoB
VDQTTILIVADDDADFQPLAASLTDDIGTYDVVGPLPAFEALRFCSRVMPVVALVHVDLRDISAAEFCVLMRGRANGARVALLLYGPARAAASAHGSAVAAADGHISGTDSTDMRAWIDALARPTVQADEPPINQYQGRHLRARFDRVEVVVDGRRIDLTRRELALLQFLLSHTNRVLGRADLLGHVWHNDNDGRSRTVDVHIRRLRAKLGEAGKQIETVPGLGYRFAED